MVSLTATVKHYRVAALAALAFIAAPCLAAEDAGNLAGEIIYRVNLGRAEDVSLLIKQGASPDQADESGVPALALAAARKDQEGTNVLKALLKGGANVNAADGKGQTALFYAAKTGNAEAVTALLENKADYYRADAGGDIARTIAHRAGHPEIVTLMDDFITAETKKIEQQYKDYNAELEQRYKDMEAAGKPAEPRPEALPAPSIKSGQNSPEFRQNMRNLSFHACALQYWSLCRELKQTTDLSADELAVAVSSNREAADAIRQSGVEEYRAKPAYVEQVSQNAMQRIANQLNLMPSNTYRFEHGVCRMNDMRQRCDEIADHWGADKIRAETLALPSKPSPGQPKLRKDDSRPAFGGR